MSRRLEAAWNDFRAKVIPANAPAAQLREMRRAFYAGVETFWQIQLNAYDGSTPEPTEEDLAVLDGIQNELQEFAANVAAGVA